MGKIIRWQGLVAFVVVLGLLMAISLIFLDTWIRIGIEQGAGRLVGAEVNVERVEHRFSPFGLSLYGVQVTDTEKPTHNRIQLESISADIELLPLLMDKIIIDELSARGLAFDQPRAREGRVYASVTETVREQAIASGVSMPSVDEVLARSPLQTTRAVENAQAVYEDRSTALAGAYENLPTRESLDSYRQRLEALQETDYENPAELLAAREEFESILDELREERQKLQSFRETVSSARAELGEEVATLRAAPGRDYDLLKGLVAGDAGAYSELTEAVFGPQARAWSERLFVAYELLAPMLANKKEEEVRPQRGEGRWIDFADTRGLPALLIRNADVSVSWGEQSFASLWQDITTDHQTLGRPTTFSVNADNTPQWQSLAIEGNFRLLESGLQASQQWDLDGVRLNDLSLSDAGNLSSRLQSALLSSTGSLNISDNALDGNGQINLSSLAIEATGSNTLTNLIADSLKDLSELSISADIAGMLNAPEFSVGSDLDRQMARVLADNVSGADQARLDELRQKLDAMGADALAQNTDQLSQWQSWEGVTNDRLGSVQELLGMRLGNVVDNPVEGLRDRLPGGLFGD